MAAVAISRQRNVAGIKNGVTTKLIGCSSAAKKASSHVHEPSTQRQWRASGNVKKLASRWQNRHSGAWHGNMA